MSLCSQGCIRIAPFARSCHVLEDNRPCQEPVQFLCYKHHITAVQPVPQLPSRLHSMQHATAAQQGQQQGQQQPEPPGLADILCVGHPLQVLGCQASPLMNLSNYHSLASTTELSQATSDTQATAHRPDHNTAAQILAASSVRHRQQLVQPPNNQEQQQHWQYAPDSTHMSAPARLQHHSPATTGQHIPA